MKKLIKILSLSFSIIILSAVSTLASPEQEKIFIDSYKKAFEEKDEETLLNFLYSKGADSEALEFYKMMMTIEMGSKIDSIELRSLTSDEIKKASSVIPSPSGGNAKLPVRPSKKLVVKIRSSGQNGNSTSSSESFVAVIDGKLLILLPIPAK